MRGKYPFLVSCTSLFLHSAAAIAAPIGTAFTFQGQLKRSGAAVSDVCTFGFALYDAATAGNLEGGPVEVPNIDVVNGNFQAPIDFGTNAIIGDEALFLQIECRCPADADFVPFDSRLSLTPAPLALALPGLYTQQTASTPNVVAGYSGNTVTPGATGAVICGGGESGQANAVTSNYGTVGGGKGNSAGDAQGMLAVAQYATVAGGRGNIANAHGAFVGGGTTNLADGSGSFIGGGTGSRAGGLGSAVVGGLYNAAYGAYDVVAGGWDNAASGDLSTICGGQANTAGGDFSTVAGGFVNTAGGSYSFAAGRRAHVRTPTDVGGVDTDGDEGTFAWADSTGADFTSGGPNQFLIRASGGVRFYSNATATVGVQLAAGGNAWSPISDRNVKENLAPIDTREVLERVAALPVATWNLISQDPAIRHIGPMAQDFYAAFGVGECNTHISTTDADGVALAAIQGLHQLVKLKDAEIASQSKRIGELETRMAQIEAMLAQSSIEASR